MRNRKVNQFTHNEKLKILELHKKVGNKWKLISFSFKNMNENEIKNQFFSLIRKSLRNTRKILGLYSNSDSINKILPKVLTIFIKKTISVILNKENTIIVNIYDFIIKYCNDIIMYDKIVKMDFLIIKKCLNFLEELNDDYLKKKMKKKEFKNFKKFENKKSNFFFKSKKFLSLKVQKEGLENEIFMVIQKDFEFEEKKKILVSLYHQIGEILKKINKMVRLMDQDEYQNFFLNKNLKMKNDQKNQNNIKEKNTEDETKRIKEKKIYTNENKRLNNQNIFLNQKICELFNLEPLRENEYQFIEKKVIKI